MPRPIRATISASALAHNFMVAKAYASGAKVWAVLKANAYGHGLERAGRGVGGVTRSTHSPGVGSERRALEAADGFAVLDFQEAARLRVAGFQKPILMLEGVIKPVDVPLLHKYALTAVLHSAAQVDMLRSVHAGGPIDIYLKLNSGMNRLWFTPE